jgi:hypothetical protein
MIHLTEEQRQELKGDLTRVIDPQTKKIYVLVSEEAYERMQALLAPERLPRSEQQALLYAAGLRAGWDDPEMEIYDREENNQESP